MKVFFARKIKGIKKVARKWSYLHLPLGRKVYCLDAPDYENLGDSAIALAQTMFLEKCGFDKSRIKVFSGDEYTANRAFFKRHIGKKHLICGVGGGNMGNQWYEMELLRYRYLRDFPKNPIVIFPQTVYFTKDKAGQKAIGKSKEYYENHRDLVLVAREKKSFDLMNDLYRSPQKILTPDIVLSTTMGDYGVESSVREGALLVFRQDVEKSMSDFEREKVMNRLETLGIPFSVTDMHAVCGIRRETRLPLVREKMEEFAEAKIVITDRLHAMVFAAITQTPCIVFSNYNHKVKGTYEWIRHLNYIRFVENADDIDKHLQEVLDIKDCCFDNGKVVEAFEPLRKVIDPYVN